MPLKARGYSSLRFGSIAFLSGVLLSLVLGNMPVAKSTAATAPATQGVATEKNNKKSPQNAEEMVLAFAGQYEPEVFRWLHVLKDKDPKRYTDLIHEFTPEVRKLTELQKRNPKMFELTIEDRRLYFRTIQFAREAAPAATGPAEEMRRQKLESLVRQQFEVRQKLRELELEDLSNRVQALQKQVDRMKSDLTQREKNKDTLIDQRVDDLNNHNAKMEW